MRRRLVPYLQHGQLGRGTVSEPVRDHRPPLARVTPDYMKQSSAKLFVDGIEVLSPMEEWFLPEFNCRGERVTSRHDRLGALCYIEFAELCEQLSVLRAEGAVIGPLVLYRCGGKPITIFTIDVEEFPSEDELRRDIFIDKNGIVYLQACEDSHRSAGFYRLDEMKNFLDHHGDDFI
ncbi:MAG: hypothetical protein P1P90_06115 [Patescibacteria group bacterium]|nr:hypothetical protein [Patescibacteria group bacterium]